MKKTIKTTLAIVLALVMLSSSLTCFAAGLNQDAVNEHKGQFKNYVLLGDSVASGYRDVMSDNDDAYNQTYQQTVYCRVPGSYADVLTKAIIEDDTMTAFAAPGYRTIEIRYMLEDDFTETDEYMFHPSQLDTVGDAGSEEYRTAYKKAVAEADLITLGVGGNDWGAYLGWVIADIFEKENVADKYIKQINNIVANGTFGVDMVEDLVEVAHIAGALPELLTTIPLALSSGLGNFYKNWDIMIQDIYNLNPDVTLMVLGMSDNSVKGKYFGYNGNEGEVISVDAATQSDLVKIIVDFIMSVGNKPMIDGAEKFDYIYVDTAGTTYVESHPDADGHAYIANKIIEALPLPNFPYKDVNKDTASYREIEYVYKNNIMNGTSETAFSPYEKLSKAQLAETLYNLAGQPSVEGMVESFEDVDSNTYAYDAIVWATNSGILDAEWNGDFKPNKKVSSFDVAVGLLREAKAENKTTAELIGVFAYAVGCIAEYGQLSQISRANAAKIFANYSKI